MIVSGIVLIEQDGDAIATRKIKIDGSAETVAHDITALGYALAENARRNGFSKSKTNAHRIMFEQAFAAGFRMTEDEVNDMDIAEIEEMEKFVTEFEQIQEGLMS